MSTNYYHPKPHLRRLTWCKWERKDSYDKEKYTTFHISIYSPTWERPYVTLLISISNGGGRVFFRAASVADLQSVLIVPGHYLERLMEAEQEALRIADQVGRDMRLALQARNLAPGSCVVRTDTGEIIAEAERILGGG